METGETAGLLGFLDGQTTNPTLLSRHPAVRRRVGGEGKFTEQELIHFYEDVVKSISAMVPEGSVSVEVFADATITADTMLNQGRTMYSWIPNAHIKFPASREGLKAAEQAVKEGMRVNMTLCFSQEQAAAVYAATRGAKRGQVFVSPFIGRLDDAGENGMDLIANIIAMYKQGDGHVEVLTASVRKLAHIMAAISLGSDIVTAPFEVLRAWGEKGGPLPGADYRYDAGSLRRIPYRVISLDMPWQDYDIRHILTDKGMERFSRDWNALITSEEKKAA